MATTDDQETSSSLASIDITVRKPAFDFSDTPEQWLASLEASHFMHAVAVMVPVTERLVIERLRATEPKVTNPQLKHEIAQVIKQEGIHARHHRAINQQLIKHGFTAIPKLERFQSCFFKMLIFCLPRSFVDAIPAAMEHFTSNISKSVLTDHSFWFDERIQSDAARFLKWHAFEELEHQAVCFDLYKALNHTPLFFSMALLLFWMPISAISIYSIHTYFLLKSQRLKRLSAWKQHIRFILKTLPIFFSGAWKYSKQSYSPWTTEDKQLHQREQR
jgi:predicted metal-dependent hydrolase